jgi:hypothetical protein
MRREGSGKWTVAQMNDFYFGRTAAAAENHQGILGENWPNAWVGE